ncbi:MAG TPA: potassium-transporting ATPase subunit C, partial [Candidatus Limnocylindrales bacterium]|nr:potassium-transporting ATPase subunit C [Candidatus Limnocylindrales bacterium]
MSALWRHYLRPALAVLAGLTLVTGIAYPAAVTAVAQLAFPAQANGSMIVADGRTVGSTLIGQAFSGERYFWGRPSAAGAGYDGMASGGSNFG